MREREQEIISLIKKTDQSKAQEQVASPVKPDNEQAIPEHVKVHNGIQVLHEDFIPIRPLKKRREIPIFEGPKGW